MPVDTHITVDAVVQANGGTLTPFAVLQPRDRGAPIAEWNERTPSSAIDIDMTSHLATIA